MRHVLAAAVIVPAAVIIPAPATAAACGDPYTVGAKATRAGYGTTVVRTRERDCGERHRLLSVSMAHRTHSGTCAIQSGTVERVRLRTDYATRNGVVDITVHARPRCHDGEERVSARIDLPMPAGSTYTFRWRWVVADKADSSGALGGKL